MQRRRFLQLTGLSTAALFFKRPYANAGSPHSTLHFPSSIRLLKNGIWLPLKGPDGAKGNRWTLDDLSVLLQHTASGMNIDLSAPITPLEKIRLSWPLSFPTNASSLGD